jgi:hypothetical protein
MLRARFTPERPINQGDYLISRRNNTLGPDAQTGGIRICAEGSAVKIVKGFFLGIGAVVAAVVLTLGYLHQSSQSALPRTEAAIEKFMADFTETWNFENVAGQMTERNLADMLNVQRSGALIQIGRLGRFRKSENARLVHYQVNSSTNIAVVEFLGHFESGRARMQIAVEDKDGRQRIAGFKLVLDGPITSRTTQS